MAILISILTNRFTWYALGGALLAGFLFFAYHHYENLKTQAALVPGLQKANAALVKQSARDDSRASKAAIDLVAAQAARDQALEDYAKFQNLAGQVSSTLEGISKNANASKLPVCLPTDAERQLFNSTVARFSGSHAGAGSP